MAPFNENDFAEIEAKTSTIFKLYKCDFVYLGGSVAEGTTNWWSDVDFFVHATLLHHKNVNEKFKWREDLTFDLVKLLRTDAVHVNILADLPLNVQYNVISKGKVIFEQDDGSIRADYIEWMLPRYYDFKIWYTRMIDEWTY